MNNLNTCTDIYADDKEGIEVSDNISVDDKNCSVKPY